MSNKFYAVKVGRQTGIYNTWAECEAQVKGFSGAQYKSFKNIEDAQAYLGISDTPSSASQPSHIYQVYTDGSYSTNHPEKYGWAFVVMKDGEIIYENSGSCEGEAVAMRNVAGELTAAMRAVLWAKENGSLISIYYDYEGIGKWLTGEWKAKNKFVKAYVDFMNKGIRYVYSIHKVNGHSGILGNDRADKLARKALTE